MEFLKTFFMVLLRKFHRTISMWLLMQYSEEKVIVIQSIYFF